MTSVDNTNRANIEHEEHEINKEKNDVIHSDFVHLHVHTEYSLLDSSNKIKDYVARLKELGMTSGAITDHGVMYGVIDFYNAMKAENMNPILGCEIYVAPRSRYDKNLEEGKYNHLVLLAETNQGYSNLMKICSRGFTEGFYYKPRVDFEVLEKYHEGIIALSACLAGKIPKLITNGKLEEAEAECIKYEKCFGKGNFFLELQDHGISEQNTVNMQLINFSKKLGIGLVVTNDVHYTYKSDAESHDVLLCIQTDKKITDTDRMKYNGNQFYLKSEDEMKSLFPYTLEAITNTKKIADRCHVDIEFGVTKVPEYEVPKGYNTWTYLNKICHDGLIERYPNDLGVIGKQLDYELSVIQKMGYVEYFLIVWDFINWAKKNSIPVGPGRGSAAGSLVSYCTGITNIDPIKYNLLFERFLNPERVSMPDIDVDFCYERRQEVIEYVKQKYGELKVVQIITFGTMAARGVIKDVGRAMDIPYAERDKLAKMIPKELNITINKALEMNPELKTLYDTESNIKKWINMSIRLEGLPRQTGTHAAGVVICQKNAEEYMPLAKSANGEDLVAQFTMTTIEELGLLKMDFLGLRTLTVIDNAIKNIKKSQNLCINIDKINYNDKDVLQFIGTGRTDGIFQLESGGMKGFMKELKPQSLEDIIAGISLYRPGPMDFIPKYIKGKNSPETIIYECPQLKHILEPTHGCIVYQEQVMQIVRDLGGYTMGRSDLVRRAMSKKKQYVMEQERKNFIYGNSDEQVPGCEANGIIPEVADQIYGTMMDFAKYAFNKSHAASYAIVSYQTAWLKYYYPVEYMAANMSSVIDAPNKLTGYIQASRKDGIEMLPPDINKSEEIFTVENENIRYAMTAVKGVGLPVIKEIVKYREKNGRFTSFTDLIRISSKLSINKKCMENFIKAGILDGLGGTRKQFNAIYAEAMTNITASKKKEVEGQISLFDMASVEDKQILDIQLPNVGEWEIKEKLQYEKEVTGIYISGHPLSEYDEIMKKYCTANALGFMLNDETNETELGEEEKVLIGGIINEEKSIYTKKTQLMAFATLEDMYGTVEVIVFPKVYEKYKEILKEDKKLLIEGSVSLEEGKNSKIIAKKITDMDEIPKKVWIRINSSEDFEEQNFFHIFNEIPGSDSLILYFEKEKEKKMLQQKIHADANNIELIVKIYGKNNVCIVV